MLGKLLPPGGRKAPWIAGFAAGSVAALGLALANFTPSAHSQESARAAAAGPVASFADVVERVSPAVVNIAVTKVSRSFSTSGEFRPRSPLDEFFGRFFDFGLPPGAPVPRRSEGLGSGFIVDPDGYIVTNNHVIDGADTIRVTLQDGRKFDATLVGRDTKTDLALLKIDAENLPAVELGDSDRARVGDWVIAIGNPFGLGGTATAGIISARGRDIRSGPYDDYMQIDAPINSGNSGGPVFNTAGEVIGVNTAIYSPTGGNIGIGFAIPSNQVKTVIRALREEGVVERGWLGVQIQDLDEDLAKSLGLRNTNGALVADVVEGGPAEKAGVQDGDVITRFAGREIDSARTLSRAVAEARPNQSVEITVWRDGRSRNLTVQLGNQASDEPVLAGGAASRANVGGELGLTLQPLTDRERAQLDLPPGTTGALIAAVEPGSPAAQKGLRPGDVITQVNRRDVSSVNDAVNALNQAKARKENALLTVRRGDGQRFVALSFS